MKLLRSFPALAFTVVLLSIVGFCVAQRSVGLLLVAGVLAAMSWYVTEGPRGRSLPRWTSNVLVIAISLNVFVDLLQHRDDVMGVLGRFIVWLTLIKLYQRKAPRDYAQLLALSLLLALLGCLQSTDLLFAASLLLYAVLGLYVLLLYQLYASYERARSVRLGSIPGGSHLVPSMQPIFGRHPGLHFRSLMVGVGLAGLLFSAVVFVIFPREVGQGLIGSLAATPSRSTTGFGNEVNLISGTRITESRKVALNLRLSDRAHRPFRHDRPLRLRGAALDWYDGEGRWTTAPLRSSRVIDTEPPGFVPLGPLHGTTGPEFTQEFDVHSPSRTLFSVYVPVSIATKNARTIKFDTVALTLQDTGPGRLRHYVVKANPAPDDETLQRLAGAPATGSQIVERFRGFDPAVSTLARDLLVSANLTPQAPETAEERWRWNQDAANVLAEYFHAPAFVYTIDTSDLVLDPNRDPIVQFIFDTKQGHCEYFASALAAMCNCVGIPARLVTGYIALEFDETSAQYIVRESNAHAWVEVQTGRYRWATFDPTPPKVLRQIHGANSSLADRMRWVFDRFEARWSNGFVEFDRHSQTRLMQTLDLGWSKRLSEALEWIRQWMARVNRAFRLGPAGYIWMGTVALALVVAVIALIKLMRRTVQIRTTLRLGHIRGREYQRMLRQLGFYLDMLTVLHKAGRAKPIWQPPLHYAGALARRQPDPAAVVSQITAIFYAARYGNQPLTHEQVTHARSLVQQLANSLGVRWSA